MQNKNKNLNDLNDVSDLEDESLEIILKNSEEDGIITGSKFGLGSGDESLDSLRDEEKIEFGDEKKIDPLGVFAVKKGLLKIKKDVENLLEILEGDARIKAYEEKIYPNANFSRQNDLYKPAKIVEGVFDGAKMIGADGESYDVPPNYASKSKLVEGDILKLRILENGKFIYKQIEKTERKIIAGKIFYSEELREYYVALENGKKYRVLAASVTYYKGESGDEAIISIPASGESLWGAVENISKKQ